MTVTSDLFTEGYWVVKMRFLLWVVFTYEYEWGSVHVLASLVGISLVRV